MAKITHDQHMLIVKAFDTIIMQSRADDVYKIACGIRKELRVDQLKDIESKDFDFAYGYVIGALRGVSHV